MESLSRVVQTKTGPLQQEESPREPALWCPGRGSLMFPSCGLFLFLPSSTSSCPHLCFISLALAYQCIFSSHVPFIQASPTTSSLSSSYPPCPPCTLSLRTGMGGGGCRRCSALAIPFVTQDGGFNYALLISGDTESFETEGDGIV